MKFTKKEVFFGVLLLFSFVTVSVLFYGYQVLFASNFQVEKEDRYLTIPPGENFKELLARLKEAQIVHDPLSFAFLSQFLKYQDNIKPGRYLIRKNMNNLDAVRMLRAGNQAPVRVTFNNIRTREDFCQKIAEYLSFPADSLCVLLQDSSYLAPMGFDTLQVLSLFIPDTYEFYWNTSPQNFVKKMYKQYNRFWNEERVARADSMGLLPQQIAVLASIVQAETNIAQEKPRIAGLYLNRLRKNMHLEADPTLVFAHQDFSLKRVLNRHKEIDSPFNTYKYPGLPPGPINMPSRQSLEAVLNYEEHEYLFFCAKEDLSGYHNFAETYAEHLKNARLFHAALDKRGIF